MNHSSSFRIFLSAASGELAWYRQEIARVLRRKGIEVCEQQDFRLGGATLLEKLNQYIEQCDAVICLIGDRCGSLPTIEHMDVMDDCEWTTRFREASGVSSISYTQWEFLLAKSLNKKTYVFFSDKTFEPDSVGEEQSDKQLLQAAYREWIRTLGQDRAALTSDSQLIEDVLVLPFPDLSSGQPNNLPLTSLGSLFKGREQFLHDLHQQLIQPTPRVTAITTAANRERAKAVYGYGGIGKTRTAIEYAWRYSEAYSALLFLSAETPDALESNLAGLSDVVSSTDLAGATDEQRINESIAWLQKNTGWLLIIDNVDTDVAALAIKARLPQLSQGHVLITSRLSQWGASIETVDLGVLDLDDATSYLLEATEADRTHSDQDNAHAKAVAIKTGQLALGLEHAAAWINAQYKGFEDYLSQWAQDESDILEEFDRNQISYPHELLVTWKLSVDRLDDEARHLLDVLSWLSPELIPDAFFQAAPDENHNAARKAIASLVKYSLATRLQQDEQRGFQIHRLVQSTTRYHQLQAEDGELLRLDKALAWINEAYQGNASDVRDWPTLEPLAEHVDRVCDYGIKHQKTGHRYPTSRLLNDLAQLYDHKARYAEAEPLMRRALSIDENSFGEDHPKVAIRLNNLAQLLLATNRLSEAEPLMRRALSIDENSFGEDHPKVATDLNNLAQLLLATNRLSEAEPLMRRALSIDENSFGEDHPKVAIRLNNLASLLLATNRLSEAEPLMRRALSIDENSFGEDHPKVAIRLNNLAQLLLATNRLSEAEPLMRRALSIDENSFGEDHPKVATDLNNLASLLLATNRLSEAEPLMRRALSIDENSFGEDHPKVAIRLNNLASLLKATNRLSEAEPLMRRVVEIFRDFSKATGHDHPHLETAVNNYRHFLLETGLTTDQAHERVQEIFLSESGP